MVDELIENWFDPLRDHGIVIGGCQEVGHAGDDADGGLLPDLAKGILKEGQLLTEQDLGT